MSTHHLPGLYLFFRVADRTQESRLRIDVLKQIRRPKHASYWFEEFLPPETLPVNCDLPSPLRNHRHNHHLLPHSLHRLPTEREFNIKRCLLRNLNIFIIFQTHFLIDHFHRCLLLLLKLHLHRLLTRLKELVHRLFYLRQR